MTVIFDGLGARLHGEFQAPGFQILLQAMACRFIQLLVKQVPTAVYQSHIVPLFHQRIGCLQSQKATTHDHYSGSRQRQ